MRARHRLGKFILRHDRRMPTTCWGVTRRAWLGRQAFELPGQQQAFDDYLFALDQVDRRIENLEAELSRLAQDGPHRGLIARLRCIRGIDTLTAIGLAAEVGDFTRFATAEQFMGFVGLVPSERSSGESRRQGSITRAGSSHARRLLVESAWHARRRPTVGYELGRRHRGQDPTSPRARVALPATTAPKVDKDGRPRQAQPEDRRCMRARARRVRVGDRYRPANKNQVNDSPASVGWRADPPRRRTLAASMRHQPAWRPATLDRGSSRRTPVMRHQPANVSLTHRRCPGTPATPRPRHSAPTRARPLTFCSMSDAASSPCWSGAHLSSAWQRRYQPVRMRAHLDAP